MARRLYLATAAAWLLVGCGDDPRDAVPDEETIEAATLAQDEADAAETIGEPVVAADAPLPPATVTDRLGTFEGDVYGLALWENPTITFGGAVLAANGEAGLAVVPIDAEVEGTLVEGTFDGPIAVGYTEETSLVAAVSGEQIRLYTVDETRSFQPIGSIDRGAGSLCMVGTVLLALGQEAVGYAIGADGTAETAFTVDAPEGAVCAATADRFYIGSPDGSISAYDLDGGEIGAGRHDGEGPIEKLAVVTMESGPVLVALGEGGLIVDGEASDRVAIDVTGSEGPLVGATAIAAGSGNFGSIYRDGVVALLANSDLLLLPWAGVARAAGLQGTETISIRPNAPVSAEPELTLPPSTVEEPPVPSVSPGR